MKRYLIIADDFTGANDTGVQLAKRGIETKVVLAGENIKQDQASYVLDTESRNISEEAAYELVKKQLAGIFAGFDLVYKKIDSTLRGNITAEIRAMDEVYHWDLIIFAPAFPEVGRTTKDAVHFLNNVRLTATEFAKDPHKPVLEDNIQKLLQAGLKENVSHHNLQQIREGKINFGGARIHTFDAEDNQDLEKIARAAQATEKEILWVGSAGLANMIISVDKPFKPGLAIVGSLSEVSRTQVEYGQKMGMGLLEIHMGHILKGKKATSEIEKAVETLKRGEDLIITTSYDLEAYEEALRVGRELKMSREEIGFAVPKALGDICAEIIKKTPVAGIFVTGGDTAMGFLNSVKATGSTIIQEIITGIPLVRLNGGDFDGLKLVTKAGGFGDEKALHYSLAKIKESS